MKRSCATGKGLTILKACMLREGGGAGDSWVYSFKA